MMNTVWVVIQNGRIKTLDKINAPEGTRVLVTLLIENETDFRLNSSSQSINEVWNNEEDDRYAELLEK